MARALCVALAVASSARAEPLAESSPRVEPPGESVPPPEGRNEHALEKPVLLVPRGQCPNREATEQHLAPLLRRHRIVAAEAAGKDSVIATSSDEGARFRVAVAGTDRLVDEPARDCIERARIAAILIAMALEPPAIASAEPPPVAPKPPPAPPPPPASASPRLSLGVEGYALLAGGLEPGSVGPGVGPLGALRAGLDDWFARLSVGYVPARALEVTRGSAELARVPLDLGIGYSWSFAPWALDASVGLAADPLFVHAEGLDNARDEVRFDVGPRAALGASLGPRSLKGIVLLRAAWFPRNYELSVNRAGQSEPMQVGETPRLWLELALGLRFGLR